MRLYKNNKLTLQLGHELTDEDVANIKALADKVRPRFQQLMEEGFPGTQKAHENPKKSRTVEPTPSSEGPGDDGYNALVTEVLAMKRRNLEEPLVIRMRDAMGAFDAARHWGVSNNQVYRLIKLRLVPGAFQGPNRRWMIPKEVDLRELVAKHGGRRRGR